MPITQRFLLLRRPSATFLTLAPEGAARLTRPAGSGIALQVSGGSTGQASSVLVNFCCQ